jgi:hypothetical protein
MRPAVFEIVVLALAAGVLAGQLLVSPAFGVANNGDYDRFLSETGLAHLSDQHSERYWRHVNLQYRIVPRSKDSVPYLSSTTLLIHAARWLSIRAGRDRVFDLRVLAALYALVLLSGIWLVLLAARALPAGSRGLLAGLLVLVLTDVGYTAYFNSLYSEGTAFSFLVVAVGSAALLMAEKSSSVLLLSAYFLATAVFVLSKPMYAPLAPVVGLFGVYLSGYVRWTGRYWLSAVLAVALCLLATAYYFHVPRVMREAAAYIGILMDLLPNSSTREEDLMALGLKPEYAVFSGTTPYQATSPIQSPPFRLEFGQKVGSFTLPLFYLARPQRLYELCRRSAKHAFVTRVPHLGYYEASSGKPPRSQPYGLWSSIRERVFPRSVLFIGSFLATGAASVLVARAAPTMVRRLSLLYALLVVVAGAQCAIAVLFGGGEPDLEKHLFMFAFAFDACLILVVLGGWHAGLTLSRGRRPEAKS